MDDIFNIHRKDDSYSFIHINIDDKNKFFQEFTNYILSESNLLQYIENETSISFSPSAKNYAKLYKHLFKFIDDEILEIELEGELKDIIIDESEVISEDSNKLKIRLSKIGRIGEYINHLILSKYYNLKCIIPKITLLSDKNMSVYGIDELFFDDVKKILFFGESKISKSLKNGIALINRSLKEYEKEIKEEFKLVLSEEKIIKHPHFNVFQEKINECISFEEFIKKMEIKNLGIPIFIAHGTDLDKDEILKSLSKITRNNIFNLNTIYIVISLPIISKFEFITHLTSAIKKKMEAYENDK